MKYMQVLCLTVLFTACANTPTVETMLAEGGEVIVGGVGSLIGDDGVTLTATDGTWTSYFAPDGKKVIYIKPLNVQETLSWHFKDDGTFCEVMFKPRREACDVDSVVLVKSADGVFSRFKNGKKGKYPFKAVSGNANGFK